MQQFSVYRYRSKPVLVLTNTTFHEIEQILIAPVKPRGSEPLIQRLQIPVELNSKPYFIDFLDMATVLSHQITSNSILNLNHLHYEIKSCVDFLIDGF